MLDRPHSELQSLKNRRSALAARMSELTVQRDRLRQAEDAENDALAAIGELGRTEVAAVAEWASAGAAGTAPALNHVKREKLTVDLARAQTAAAAARGAGSAIDGELADLGREGAALEARIEAAAVGEMIELHRVEWESVQARAAEVRGDIARVLAITETLRGRAEELDARGQPEAALTMQRQLQRLYVDLRIDIHPTRAEVAAATPAWSRHIEGMLR